MRISKIFIALVKGHREATDINCISEDSCRCGQTIYCVSNHYEQLVLVTVEVLAMLLLKTFLRFQFWITV